MSMYAYMRNNYSTKNRFQVVECHSPLPGKVLGATFLTVRAHRCAEIWPNLARFGAQKLFALGSPFFGHHLQLIRETPGTNCRRLVHFAFDWSSAATLGFQNPLISSPASDQKPMDSRGAFTLPNHNSKIQHETPQQPGFQKIHTNSPPNNHLIWIYMEVSIGNTPKSSAYSWDFPHSGHL